MRKRKNKIIAGTVVAVMMAGSIIANISPLIASQTGGNSVAASETRPLIKKVYGLQKSIRMM